MEVAVDGRGSWPYVAQRPPVPTQLDLERKELTKRLPLQVVW